MHPTIIKASLRVFITLGTNVTNNEKQEDNTLSDVMISISLS